MESVGAREMVPCFDEPEYKAVWNVHVFHPLYTNAISNGQEQECEQKNSNHLDAFLKAPYLKYFTRTCFEETPKMSSYLVALVVSNYVSQETHFQTSDNRSVLLRAWSQPGHIKSTDLALKAGVESMQKLESLFQFPYPLPKMDLISVPTFSYGAMENWGLVIFNELEFLCDHCSPLQQTAIPNTVAHELAHQWFGNLVTMKWWNDIFLNEGFATFYESRVSLAAVNSTSYAEKAALITRNSAMDMDRLPESQALSADVYDAAHFLQRNNYDKGASIFRMFERVLGADNFLSSLRAYFNKYRYGNVDHINFLKAINLLEQGIPWITQSGYPAVTVKTVDQQHVELSQQSCKESSNDIWPIPIFYTLGGVEQQIVWLSNKSMILDVGNKGELVIDSKSYGYYTVNNHLMKN